jgi:putative membrane protein
MKQESLKRIDRAVITAAAAFLALAGTAAAAQGEMMSRHHESGAAMQSLSPLDKTFMKETAQGNLAEMKYAPLVYKMAQKTESKQFAQRMVRDHGQAQQSLKFLAALKGYRLPTDIEKPEKQVLRRLAREKKNNFDAAYKHEMMRDHAADIASMRREISLGHDKAVKAYAVKMLLILQGHLKMANALPIGGSYSMSPVPMNGDKAAINSRGKM